MLGGINIPKVPPPTIVPVASSSEIPRFFISGIPDVPIAAAVAGGMPLDKVGPAAEIESCTHLILPEPTLSETGISWNARAFFIPGVWSAAHSFGGVQSNIHMYLPIANGFSLAVRAGGKKMFGEYPFHEAAFIGGNSTVRGFRRERFAGDATLYGSAELRLRLARMLVIVPGNFGVFVLGDIGRVYLKGEDSQKWHPAYGGGVFFSVLDVSTTFSLAAAVCEERTSAYFKMGFSF